MDKFCVLCRKSYQNRNLLFPFPPAGSDVRKGWALRITNPPESEWRDDFRICSLHFASTAFKKRGDGEPCLKAKAYPAFALLVPENAIPIPKLVPAPQVHTPGPATPPERKPSEPKKPTIATPVSTIRAIRTPNLKINVVQKNVTTEPKPTNVLKEYAKSIPENPVQKLVKIVPTQPNVTKASGQPLKLILPLNSKSVATSKIKLSYVLKTEPSQIVQKKSQASVPKIDAIGIEEELDLHQSESKQKISSQMVPSQIEESSTEPGNKTGITADSSKLLSKFTKSTMLEEIIFDDKLTKLLTDTDRDVPSASVKNLNLEAEEEAVESPLSEDNSGSETKTKLGEGNSSKENAAQSEENSEKISGTMTKLGEGNSSKENSAPNEETSGNISSNVTKQGEENSSKENSTPSEENSGKIGDIVTKQVDGSYSKESSAPTEETSGNISSNVTKQGEVNSSKENSAPSEENSGKISVTVTKQGDGSSSKKHSASSERKPGETKVTRKHVCCVCDKPSGILFPFPKSEKLLLKWLARLKIPKEKFRPSLRVCSKHFLPKSLVQINGRIGLLGDSMPLYDKHAVSQLQEDNINEPSKTSQNLTLPLQIVPLNELTNLKPQGLRRVPEEEVIKLLKRLETAKSSNEERPVSKSKLIVPSDIKEGLGSKKLDDEHVGRIIRCIMCMGEVLRSDSVPISDSNNDFTQFGFTLVSLAKIIPKHIRGGYCCLRCSDVVIDCYDTLMDINLTLGITSNRFGNLAKTTSHAGAKNSACPEGLNMKCKECKTVCQDFTTLGHHYREHAFQRSDFRSGSSVQAADDDAFSDGNDGPQLWKGAENSLVGEAERTTISEPEENPDWSDDDDDDDSVAVQDLDSQKSKKRLKDEYYDGALCHICGKICETRIQHRNHVTFHRRKKFTVFCHLCGKKVKTTRLIFHLGQHRKESEGVMKKCGRPRDPNKPPPTSKKPKKTEKREKAENDRKRPKKRRLNLKTVICGFCGKFLLKYRLPVHMRKEHNAPLLSCPYCPSKVADLPCHVRKKHKNEAQQKESVFNGSTHDCELCPAKYLQKVMLKVHMTLKHGFDPRKIENCKNYVSDEWTCTNCSKKFKHYSGILKHVKKEHNGKGIRITCEVCEKTYTKLPSLINHVTTYHVPDYYNFKCERCGNVFVTEEKYQMHQGHCRKKPTSKRPKTRAIMVMNEARPPKRPKPINESDKEWADKRSGEALRLAISLGPPVPKKSKKSHDTAGFSGTRYSQEEDLKIGELDDCEGTPTYYSQYEQARGSGQYGASTVSRVVEYLYLPR